MFTDSMIDHIVQQSNLYLSQKPNGSSYSNDSITASELKYLFGVIILMGIKRLPSYRDYFSCGPILGCPELVSNISRNRFQMILRNLHLNDNLTAHPRTSPEYDRLHKIRPLVSMLNRQITVEYSPHFENSIIDEAMVG